MYPYLELFGVKFYMTGIGIVVACIVFVVTAYSLCKKYNQEFMRFFNRLPRLLLPAYFLGLYTSFVLDTKSLIPTSLAEFAQILSPYGYNFSFFGVVLAIFVSCMVFLMSFRRNETKKIWIDILFFSFINALIALGIFLVLGDNFIGRPYQGIFSVKALMTDSALVKFNGVYPLGIFLSLGALLINVIVTIWKIISKKNGVGVRGFILIFILFLLLLPFWNYNQHGVLPFFSITTLDINYYLLFFLIIYFIFFSRKLKRPY